MRRWKPAWKIHLFQQYFSLWIVSLLLTLNISPVFSQASHLHKSEIEKWQQQSQTYYEQGELSKAAEQLQKLIEQLTNQAGEQQNLAIAWTNLGTIQLAVGDSEGALKSWQNASQIYTELQNKNERLRLQIYQARAWQKLGHYLQSCETLTQALNVPNTLCRNQEFDRDTIAKKIEENRTLDSFPIYLDAWHFLGDNFRLIGRLEESKIILNQLSQSSSNTHHYSTQLSLGNTLKAMGNLERDRQTEPKYEYLPWRCDITSLPQKIRQDFYEPALIVYQQASQSSSITTKMNARLNQLGLLIELGRWPDAKILSKEINLTILPKGQPKVFAEINYAKNIACIEQQENLNIEKQIERVTPLLEQAQKEARELDSYKKNLNPANKFVSNQSILSITLGNLGGFYEYISWQLEQQNLERVKTKEYGEKAIWLTQEALYTAQPTIVPHIAYQWQWQMGRLLTAKGDKMKAIASYELAAKTLETVRRDLLTINSDVQFSFRDNVEPLYRQLVSLLISTDNFKNNQPILGKSIYYIEAEKALNQLQTYFGDPSRTNEIKRLSNQVYRWLIQPLEKDLELDINREESQIKTLVFVLDTSLRNIPMSTLYDSQRNQYLLGRYSFALVSSTQLLKPANSTKNFNTLLGGLSETRQFGRQTYSPLKNVSKELQNIQLVVPSTLLLNEQFTKNNLKEKLSSETFSSLHLATHGQFSSDPKETFIILFDELIQEDDLTQLLTTNRPVELLVLSACETATGDKRAVLGLAGVAIRSEALSTVATLWQVDDESTAALMSQFYRLLKENPQIDKAEALREAQLQLWQNQQKDWDIPFFWGAYVLVGNWF